MKAVFDTKAESAYDDDISSRYHFPPRYLNSISACVGDWVVFRQPRDGGGDKAYFAVARVDRIEPDPNQSGYHYAIVSAFLEFAQPVAWRTNGRYAEKALRNIEQVSQVGMYLRGRSVRVLEDDDFDDIVRAGLAGAFTMHSQPAGADERDADSRTRKVVQALVNRTVRDAAFRESVGRAYDWRCAFTGWRLTDIKGLAEVQGRAPRRGVRAEGGECL